MLQLGIVKFVLKGNTFVLVCFNCKDLSKMRSLCSYCSTYSNERFKLEDDSKICLNCFSVINKTMLAIASEEIRKGVSPNFNEEILHIQVNVPPILDISRLLLRATCSGFDKLPTIASIITKHLQKDLENKENCSLKFGDASTGNVDVEIVVEVPLEVQTMICKAINPNFLPKKKKRFPYQPVDDSKNISLIDMEGLLNYLNQSTGNGKSFQYDTNNGDDVASIRKRWTALGESIALMMKPTINIIDSNFDAEAKSTPALEVHAVSLYPSSVNISLKPIYILGRYIKYARDVPQAPWFLADDDVGNVPGNDGRKGRKSIEEIISEPVCKFLQSKACSMHACGREDIDVRMLGNGRPFVLKLLGAKVIPTIDILNNIAKAVNNREGFNANGDIAIGYVGSSTTEPCPFLRIVDVRVWQTMQAKAEEKYKAYRCVVWSSKPIVSRELLDELEGVCKVDAGTDHQANTVSERTNFTDGCVALSDCVMEISKSIGIGEGSDANVDLERAPLDDAVEPVAKKRRSNSEDDKKVTDGADFNSDARPDTGGLNHICRTNHPQKEADVEREQMLEVFPKKYCKIVQRTPLRVLHRRSLLNRCRYISGIQTVPINKHCFVMTLVTSAGTYVKELVHGDCGRTVPSVSSIFGCTMHMLQLDVVYLFDDFHLSSNACRIKNDDNATFSSNPGMNGEMCNNFTIDNFDGMSPLLDIHWGLLSSDGESKDVQMSWEDLGSKNSIL